MGFIDNVSNTYYLEVFIVNFKRFKQPLIVYFIVTMFVYGCTQVSNSTEIFQKRIILENVSICGKDCGYGQIEPMVNISQWHYKYTCVNKTYTLDVLMDVYSQPIELRYYDDCVNVDLVQ